jgi:hypothetical protein
MPCAVNETTAVPQIQRHGYGAVDLPFDHGSPRWPVVGHGNRAPRLQVSVYFAGRHGQRIVSYMLTNVCSGIPLGLPNCSESLGSGRAARCAACDGKFDLVRHYSWRTPLCSRKCVDRFKACQESYWNWLLSSQVALDQGTGNRARDQ